MFARHDGQDKQKTLKENKTGRRVKLHNVLATMILGPINLNSCLSVCTGNKYNYSQRNN